VSSASRSSASGASPRRTRSSRPWRARPLAALALVAAGCGGGNEQHDAFVEEVNAVCARHFSEIDALAAPQSSQQLLTYVNELTRLSRAQLTDLRAVEPPTDDAAAYRRMLDQMQTTLRLYPDLRDAVVTGQPAAIESVLERANSSNQKAGEAATELGAEKCLPGDDEETATGP
jgi:hypothetical protein